MTFNYSKLATLKPKFLEEEKPKDQQIEARSEDQMVASRDRSPASHQLATSGYPPEADRQVASHPAHLEASHQKQQVASHRKGDRHSKRKVLIGIRQPVEIAQQVKDFCAEHNLQIQDFYELAASHYISSVASHQVKKSASHQSANQLAHDDLMIFKTDDNIIMLFKKMTGRKWTASDDRAGAAFNSVDRRLVEIGMIHTVIQARGRRINSFKYFVPEIQTIMDAGFDRSNLDVYLKARRKMLNEWLTKQGREPIY